MASNASNAANVSDVDVALEQFKLRRLIKKLDATRGNGTSAITLILNSKQDLNLTNKMLTEEYGKAKCIKSRVNMLSVLSAITSTQQRLKRYSRTPTNGLIVFCGEVVTEDGKPKRLTIDFEPFKQINTSMYLCDNRFHTESLAELLEDDDKFGFLIIDSSEALVASVQGNHRRVLHRYPVNLPKKHGRGGQSAKRFAHLRLEARHNYRRKVGEFAVQCFIPNGETPNIKGLIVAGSAELKHDLTSDADLFDPRLSAILMPPLLDISYGGEAGLNQAIELASSTLRNVKLIHEKRLIGSFMEAVARDTGRYCIGVLDTMEALEAGAVDTLIVWEDFDMVRMVIRNPHTDSSEIKILPPERADDPKLYKDPKTKVDLVVDEEESFLDWIVENHNKFGAKLEFITDRSQEGNQFCKGFGGMGGLMRYKLEFLGQEAYDDEATSDESGPSRKDTLEDEEFAGTQVAVATAHACAVKTELAEHEKKVPASASASSWREVEAKQEEPDDWEEHLDEPALEKTRLVEENFVGTVPEAICQASDCTERELQVEAANATYVARSFVNEWEASEPDPRLHMNVVFIGHVDAGKSTTCGNILLRSGCVDDRLLEKYMNEAKENNRESWFLAYIMDTSDEEKAKGKTVEVGRAHFETANRRFTILDAPGHKAYVPNMIAGASQADIGVLLISARKDEFETGFERGGQTREHALLAKTLGVEKLLCVINKMDDDSVHWSQDRYKEIVGKLSPFLRASGFKGDQVIFLPISGLKGQNIKDRMDIPKWFQGKTLLDTLDSVGIQRSSGDASLRLPMLDGFRDMGSVMSLGKIEQGTVWPGMKCIVMPSGAKCSVAGVNINDKPVKYATIGENVTLKMTGLSEDGLKKGFVLCPLGEPVRAVTKFKAMLHVIELTEERPLLTVGYRSILHVHVAAEECEIVDLAESCPLSNQQQKEVNPQFVREKSLLWCTVSLARPTALDSFAGLQQLGRFTLRTEDKTIAIGKVIKLLASDKHPM